MYLTLGCSVCVYVHICAQLKSEFCEVMLIKCIALQPALFCPVFLTSAVTTHYSDFLTSCLA